MTSSLSLNPVLTTNAAGTFGKSWNGLIVGTVYDDPAARYSLAGGYLAASESQPMPGGVGISENIPGAANTPAVPLGGPIIRASTISKTSAGGLTGWSVFNQNHAMIESAQSQVPCSLAYMSVHIARLGSGLRLAVAMDADLVSLEGSIITSQVSWDFNAQCLTPYVASTTTIALSSVTWANTAGGRLTVVAGSAVPWGIGDTVFLAGATNTGTGVINRAFTIDTFTDSTHFTLAAPAAAGVYGTIGGSPVLDESGGLLPVSILKVEIGNSMVPVYNPDTGYTNWNRNGNAAVILI